jgi:putative transposase
MMSKKELFNKIKSKGLFWSYRREMQYDESKNLLLVETILKYGDMIDLNTLFSLFDFITIKDIWKKNVLTDSKFQKANFFLAFIYFDEKFEKLRLKNERFEKLKLLASQNEVST